jgi:hypothetical protein
LGLFVSLEKRPADPNHFTFFLERRDLCCGADSLKALNAVAMLISAGD